MKVFASESPNGPTITHYDLEKVEVCIPVDWSITAIINLETLESSSSDNMTRTAESMELLSQFLYVKASALKARQDDLHDVARAYESQAEQLHNQAPESNQGRLAIPLTNSSSQHSTARLRLLP